MLKWTTTKIVGVMNTTGYVDVSSSGSFETAKQVIGRTKMTDS